MRRLVGSNSFQNDYWESIDPRAMATVIDVLPSEEDLFYYAKLVADGLMRGELSPELRMQYARYVEGTLTYLCMTQKQEDVESLADYYIPFIYIMTKLYPHLQTLTYAHLFQQFVRFAEKQVPPQSSNDVCTVIDVFMARLRKDNKE